MKSADDEIPDAQAAKRRDEVIKRMLSTPPQPRTAKPQNPSPKRAAKASPPSEAGSSGEPSA